MNIPMLLELFSEVATLFIPSTTGTNVYTATIENYTQYQIGVPILVRFINGNTGSSTLNINGLGAITMVRNANIALLSGDITANSVHQLVYDGTYLQLQTQGAKLSALQLQTPLTGFSAGPDSPVVAADGMLGAFGKLQAQMNAKTGIVSGIYTGDGSSNKTLTLGFTPKAVLVLPRDQRLFYVGTDGATYWWGGLAVTGGPAYAAAAGSDIVSITTNGFIVSQRIVGTQFIMANLNGYIFNYMAFK